MHIEYVPTLAVARDLYRMPRDMERFRAYLRTMVGDPRHPNPELELPLVAMNPMAREHALEAVEHLIALGADEVAREATAEASDRVASVGALADIAARMTLVVSDDIGGMWTDRVGSEVGLRWGERTFGSTRPKRAERPATVLPRWLTGITWTSERPNVEGVRRLVLASVYRAAHMAALGAPDTLGAMLRQEARTARFAGLAVDAPSESARAIVAGAWDDASVPVVYAAWGGDDAARAMGYDPLGLRLGEALAVALEQTEGEEPLDALARVGDGAASSGGTV